MSTPTVADLVAVKPLEWKPAGYDGQSLEASALGLEVCFRVHGKPGDWTLTSPGAREYVHTPGYETRADATAAAQTDFERRILAALSPAATEPVAWMQRHKWGPRRLCSSDMQGDGDWSDPFPVYAHPSPVTVEAMVDAVNMARNRLEMIADNAWNGDGRDLKRSIAGVFSDFDVALRALTGEKS